MPIRLKPTFADRLAGADQVLVGLWTSSGSGVAAEIVAGSGADLVLMAVLRKLPWRTLPPGTAVMVLAIGVLSVAATPHLHVDRLLRGTGPLAQLKVVLVCAVLAALINNLPAALIVFAAARITSELTLEMIETSSP